MNRTVGTRLTSQVISFSCWNSSGHPECDGMYGKVACGENGRPARLVAISRQRFGLFSMRLYTVPVVVVCLGENSAYTLPPQLLNPQPQTFSNRRPALPLVLLDWISCCTLMSNIRVTVALLSGYVLLFLLLLAIRVQGILISTKTTMMIMMIRITDHAFLSAYS